MSATLKMKQYNYPTSTGANFLLQKIMYIYANYLAEGSPLVQRLATGIETLHQKCESFHRL